MKLALPNRHFMNTRLRLSAIATIALVSAGCTTTALFPRDLLQKEILLGEAVSVERVGNDVLRICRSGKWSHAACQSPDDFVILTVNTSRNPFAVHKFGFPIPRDLRVTTAGVFSGGTIVAISTSDMTAAGKSSIPQFKHIAAEPDDPTCRWEGSKISTWGGVVCPRLGYDYRKILNPDRK